MRNSHCYTRAEAAIALRQRLNESVDQLDTLRKEHAELEVKADTLERELTIAKSDCQPFSVFSLS
jgi:protein HOOK3